MSRALPARVSFVAMTMVFAAFFVAAGAPTPLLPIYELAWGFPTWAVTVAFGVYAIGLLLTLLVVGSVSDHIGRRPVRVAAVALELASMLVLLLAPDIGWIIAARVLQGVATGAATASFSAAILELAPEALKAQASVITSIVPALALGSGALYSGAVAERSDVAATIVWSSLVGVMLVALPLAAVTPETVSRRQGALASLRPHVAVPPGARRVFLLTLPSEIAAWLVSALFLGLMPTILRLDFGVHSPFVGGLAVFANQGAGALTPVLLSKARPARLLVGGGVAIVAGLVLLIVSTSAGSVPLLWIGAIVGGAGLGASFSGTIRSLVPLVQPHQRAGLFAAIYVVSYLTFGVPVIVAGILLGTVGVTAIVLSFGAVIIAAAVVGVVLQLTAGERPTTGARVALPERR